MSIEQLKDMLGQTCMDTFRATQRAQLSGSAQVNAFKKFRANPYGVLGLVINSLKEPKITAPGPLVGPRRWKCGSIGPKVVQKRCGPGLRPTPSIEVLELCLWLKRCTNEGGHSPCIPSKHPRAVQAQGARGSGL